MSQKRVKAEVDEPVLKTAVSAKQSVQESV